VSVEERFLDALGSEEGEEGEMPTDLSWWQRQQHRLQCQSRKS
jgi:hypothetical protein